MAIKPEVLDAMVAAGCSAEQIAAAVKADMSSRSNGAERQARYRARLKGTNTVTGDVTKHNETPQKEVSPHTPLQEKPIPPSPPKGGSSPKGRSSDLDEFKAEFPELDADRLNAIVKLRRSKRGQLTGHAAKLFRRDAEACGLSLADAVDTCISRNWITVKAEWLDSPKGRANAPPPRPKPKSVGDMFADQARQMMNGYHDEPANKPDRHISQGDTDRYDRRVGNLINASVKSGW